MLISLELLLFWCFSSSFYKFGDQKVLVTHKKVNLLFNCSGTEVDNEWNGSAASLYKGIPLTTGTCDAYEGTFFYKDDLSVSYTAHSYP